MRPSGVSPFFGSRSYGSDLAAGLAGKEAANTHRELSDSEILGLLLPSGSLIPWLTR